MSSLPGSPSQPVRNVWLSWLALGLAALFVVGVRLQFVGIPLERDEGSYIYCAQRLLEGETPYRDFYEIKPPGLFYAYALLLGLSGGGIPGLQCAFILVNVLNVVIVYGLGRKLLDRVAAAAAAASYALLALTPHATGFTMQAEHLVVSLAFGGILLLLGALRGGREALLLPAGALLCGALLVKQNAVFLIGLAVAYLGLHLRMEQHARVAAWRQAALLGTGLALPGVLVAFVLLLQGAFGPFVYWTVTYPRHYVSLVSWSVGLSSFSRTLGRIVVSHLWLWALAGLGLALVSSNRVAGSTRAFFWLLLPLAFATVFPGFWFYGHYFLIVLPVIALLAGAALSRLRSSLAPKIGPSWALVLVVALFVLAAGANVVKLRGYYFRPDHTRIVRQVYGLNPFPEAKVISEFLSSGLQEGDQLLVLGAEPEVYVYTRTRSPSKHFDVTYLVDGTAEHVTRQREFIEDVERAAPRYVVFFKQPVSWVRRRNSDKRIFGWLDAYVRANYERVGLAEIQWPDTSEYWWHEAARARNPRTINSVLVFERKPTAAPAAESSP